MMDLAAMKVIISNIMTIVHFVTNCDATLAVEIPEGGSKMKIVLDLILGPFINVNSKHFFYRSLLTRPKDDKNCSTSIVLH